MRVGEPELRASTDVIDDDALRARLREDGYLYFPGLLDAAALGALRNEILEPVATFGWTLPGTDPSEAVASQPARWHGMEFDPSAPSDVSWRDGYHAIQRLEALHRQANDPVLLGVMQRLLGVTDVLVHGQRIVRVVWPAL